MSWRQKLIQWFAFHDSILKSSSSPNDDSRTPTLKPRRPDHLKSRSPIWETSSALFSQNKTKAERNIPPADPRRWLPPGARRHRDPPFDYPGDIHRNQSPLPIRRRASRWRPGHPGGKVVEDIFVFFSLYGEGVEGIFFKDKGKKMSSEAASKASSEAMEKKMSSSSSSSSPSSRIVERNE